MDPASANLPLDFLREHLQALYEALPNHQLGTVGGDHLLLQIVEAQNLLHSRDDEAPLIANEVARQQLQAPAAFEITKAPQEPQAPQTLGILQDVSAVEFSEQFFPLFPQYPNPVSQLPPYNQNWNFPQPLVGAVPQYQLPPVQQYQAPMQRIQAAVQQGDVEMEEIDFGLFDEEISRFLNQIVQQPELSQDQLPAQPIGTPQDISRPQEFTSIPKLKRERSGEYQLLMSQTFSGLGQKRARNEVPLDDVVIKQETQEDNFILNQEPVKDEPVDEMQALFNSIRPDLEISTTERAAIETPAALNIQLMEHQKLGFAWLKKMELSKARGGILADDMGLGKTVQTLALLVDHRPKGVKKGSDRDCSRTTLLVAPKSLLKQWESEIVSKVKQTGEHCLSVLIYHGDGRKRRALETVSKYDVVITTYGVIASEYRLLQSNREKEAILLNPEAKFFRVILDEAQTIKNRLTKMSLGCCKLQAEYRLCLSGTPIQNHVQELFPLLKFLRIPQYGELAKFNARFVGSGIRSHDQTKMGHLKALLVTIMLRRNKFSTIDGKPMIILPAKHVNKVMIQLSEEEMKLYQEVENKSRGQYRKIIRENGTVAEQFTAVLVLLLRLRQICCHYYMAPAWMTRDDSIEVLHDDDGNVVIPPLVSELMKKFSKETIDRVVQTNVINQQECPICFEPPQGNHTDIFFPCGHHLCSDCIVSIQETQAVQNRQNGSHDEIGNSITCPTCRTKIRAPDAIVGLTYFTAWCHRNGKAPKEDGDVKDPDGDEKDTPDGDAVSPQPPRPSNRALHGRPWASSAKVDKCIEILKSIAEKGDEKTLIFSQFTTLIDLLSHALELASIPFSRYDGTMSQGARTTAISSFQTNPHPKVLLISIKAGNTGLNLIQASQVIVMDPMYNPYVEHQAVDRSHRIGQQREVTVHRLIVEGTIEERIIQRQEEKIGFVDEALQEGNTKNKGNNDGVNAKLRPEDLKYLLFGRN